MQFRIIKTRSFDILVSEIDYHKVNNHKWTINRQGYAVRNVNYKIVLLHRFIMNPEKGMVVDYINSNKLDNRRENLRICSNSQNLLNRGPTKRNKSGLKGVSFDTYSKSWKAQLIVNKKKVFNKRFKTKELAYISYLEAIKKYTGGFGRG